MTRFEPDHDIVRWAKSYPFGHLTDSFLFRDGEARPLDRPVEAVRGRTPVIASGSNAAPSQLARKYGGFDRGAEIPVTRVEVRDFDSVYNAHITSYGSVPATLFPSPGTRLETFITWLDDEELAVMHGTEQPGINYHYTELSGLRVDVEGIGALDVAFAYISVVGCLTHDGTPVSLAEVPAWGRRFAARRQEEMQELIRDRVAPGAALEQFILENVENGALRGERSAMLAGTARPFDHAKTNIIAVETP
jgi:hypothetical protein